MTEVGPRTRRRWRLSGILRWAVAAVVVAVGIANLAWSGGGAVDDMVHRLGPVPRGEAMSDVAFYTCVERELRALVPKGAAVVVDEADDVAYQRLTELLTPWARPTGDRRRAHYVVSVGHGWSDATCGTLRIFVRRLR